jgi:hypothetical protein
MPFQLAAQLFMLACCAVSAARPGTAKLAAAIAATKAIANCVRKWTSLGLNDA